MADAAAARREARRRRILENSHNRLQLISGKSVDTIRKESPSSHSIANEDSEVLLSPISEGLSLPPHNNGVFAESEMLEFLTGSLNMTAAGDGEAPAFPAPSGLVTETKTKSLPEKLIEFKCDIVLLSVLIQFLYSCSLFTSKETYFFLPLFMYDVTKLIWFPVQIESKLASVFLLLNGMSGARAQKILAIWQVVQEVIQDGFIYLFTTICVQSMLISMNLSVT